MSEGVDAILGLHDVHKAFDGVPVLRGIDLEVRPGETTPFQGVVR